MRRARSIIAWVLLAGAVWLAVAIATYQPARDATGVTNLGGPVGRFLSSTLVEGFGIGAFVIAFQMACLGYYLMIRRPVDKPLLRLLGVVVAMLTLGTLAQVLMPARAFPGGAFPVGGILGCELAARMTAALGTTLAGLVLLVGGVTGVLLATDGLIRWRRRSDVGGALGGLREALARSLPGAWRTAPPEGSDGGPSDPASDEDEDVAPPKRTRRKAAAPRKAARKASAKAAAPVAVADEADGADEAQEEEWDLEPDETEDEGELGEVDDDEAEVDEEEDPAEAEEAMPIPAAPRVRQAVAPVNSDGIEVIRLSREPSIKGNERYALPPLSLLSEPTYLKERESDAVLQKKASQLAEALQDFGVTARVTEIERGPVITRFDLVLERGTKISKVTALADDLALALGVQRVRIAPVKGKSALGVEIPNKDRETVYLRELAVAEDLGRRKIAIPLFLGKDASGQPIVEDLATTPHLLIAGRTGAGKSVFVNDLILSILMTRYPEECRLIMIDPKKVELEVYQDIPHLLTKVESNAKKATKILEWAVNQMEERYELLAATGVRHLTSYNKLGKKVRREKLLKIYQESEVDRLPEHLPYIVIIVDELADLMMVAGKEVEHAIARLAQKARAVGIHVVLATQRPSIDVITGLIKSNLPARIAFQTRTGIDSRTILDRYGAEKLLDKGDMLYLGSTSDDPRRIQGPFVSDDEVEAVVSYLREHASPLYTHQLEQVSSNAGDPLSAIDQDDLFEQAVDVMFASGMASASGLQRRLKVGYARASRLIDLMAEAGIVSEHKGSKAREILMTPEQWEEIRQARQGTAGVS